MGTNILVPGADFSSSAVGFNAAVPSNLAGLWFFNRGTRNSRRNLALNGIDADIVGVPEDQGTFLRFKGMENLFQTSIPDSVELTHIAVIKTPDTLADTAHQPMYLSNFGSGSKSGYTASGLSGASIYSTTPTTFTMSASRYTDGTQAGVTSSGTSIPAADVSSWKMMASRIRQDRAQRDNLTAGTTTAGNFTGANARVLAAGNFRIGSSFNTSYGGIADVAAICMYDRFISDAELATMAAQIRSVMSHIGITA